MDESYFGNRKKRLTKETKDNVPVLTSVTEKRGRGTRKVPVVGIVEKGGNVKTKIVEKLTARNLMAMLNHYVKTEESVLITDGFRSYSRMEEEIEHITVKHSERSRKANTNTIEGYWGLIKNGIKGNYKSLSKKYLPFYLVHYDYIYNNRKNDNLFDELLDRFALNSALSGVQPKVLATVENKATLKIDDYIVKSWGDEYKEIIGERR